MLQKSPFSLPTPEQIRDLNAAFEGERPEKLIAWLARNASNGEVPMVSSFGADSVVLLSMIAEVEPDYPVLFIDTGKHFMETLAYRDRIQEHFGLNNLQSITPGKDALKQKDPFGALWISDKDACCDLRKTVPLDRVMVDHVGWITGRKRFQTKETGQYRQVRTGWR